MTIRLFYYSFHCALAFLSYFIGAASAFGLGYGIWRADVWEAFSDVENASRSAFWFMIFVSIFLSPIIYFGFMHMVLVSIQRIFLPKFPFLFAPGCSKMDQKNSHVRWLGRHREKIEEIESAYLEFCNKDKKNSP